MRPARRKVHAPLLSPQLHRIDLSLIVTHQEVLGFWTADDMNNRARSIPCKCQDTLLTVPSSVWSWSAILTWSPTLGALNSSKSWDGPSSPLIHTRTFMGAPAFDV